MKKFMPLLLLAAIASLVMALWRWASAPEQESTDFEVELIRLDTSRLNRIQMAPPGDRPPFTLVRQEGRGWIATNGRVSVPAIGRRVNQLLTQLAHIRSSRLVARQPAMGSQYELTGKNGAVLEAFSGSERLERFTIGRPPADTASPPSLAYLRLRDESEIYAVDTALMRVCARPFRSYRNRQLLALPPPERITTILRRYPENNTAFSIERDSGGQWRSRTGAPADRQAIDTFLASVAKLKGRFFADEFDTFSTPAKGPEIIGFYGPTLPDTLRIFTYHDSTRRRPHLIGTNRRSQPFFSSDSTGIYQRIFSRLDSLWPNE